MTAVINKSVATASPEAKALLDFVSSGNGRSWFVYLGVHTRLRNLLFHQIYQSESFNKEAAIQDILKFYLPILVREYARYEKGEGRTTVSKDTFSSEKIKQETASLILAWLLSEIEEIHKQHMRNQY